METNKPNFLDNMPQISYSPRMNGWKDIFLGILSPHASQYKLYVQPAIQKLNNDKREEAKNKIEQKFMNVINRAKTLQNGTGSPLKKKPIKLK